MRRGVVIVGLRDGITPTEGSCGKGGTEETKKANRNYTIPLGFLVGETGLEPVALVF
jgi:hypothetical protein